MGNSCVGRLECTQIYFHLCKLKSINQTESSAVIKVTDNPQQNRGMGWVFWKKP